MALADQINIRRLVGGSSRSDTQDLLKCSPFFAQTLRLESRANAGQARRPKGWYQNLLRAVANSAQAPGLPHVHGREGTGPPLHPKLMLLVRCATSGKRRRAGGIGILSGKSCPLEDHAVVRTLGSFRLEECQELRTFP